MEYEYELKEHGFSGEEDYILKLTDMPFEEMFQISKKLRDAFDIHDGAFETETMREIYQYIETNLKEADRRIAMDIVNSFGK